MSTEHPVSDEHLNAFVDGQLDTDERSRVLIAINADEALGRRSCELRRLQDLVQHAYDTPPPAPRRQRPGVLPTGWRQAIAGALLLATGGTFGWYSHAERHPVSNLRAMYLDQEKAFQTAELDQAPVRGERRILLHLSSDAPDKLEQALDTAEQLLLSYREQGLPVEIEVVANAGGLDLLRADVSPFADRVRELQRKHDNLTFLACQTAMNRLRRERHITPDLLPEALITPNALEEILNRLQQGWMYVSV